jgi:hypothetical protein
VKAAGPLLGIATGAASTRPNASPWEKEGTFSHKGFDATHYAVTPNRPFRIRRMINTIHPSTRGAIRRSIKEGYRNWRVAEIHNVTIPQVQEIRRQLRATVMMQPNGGRRRLRILRNWWS